MGTYKNYPGTKEYLPEKLARANASIEAYRKLEQLFRACVNTYGFDEIKTPLIEPMALYNKGLGETADVVQKEMFQLNTDSSENVLRPEGTAGVVRSYIQNKLYAEPEDITKLYYTGEMFRKERPQAGRYREFTQMGVEAIGNISSYAEAEIILMADTYLKSIGLQNIICEINSIGCRTCRKDYVEDLKAYAEAIEGLCKDCETRKNQNPLRLLDCKVKQCGELMKQAPLVINALCKMCQTDYSELKAILDETNVVYKENPKLVRGLDYYEKTVFEYSDTSIGAQATICGGGRYNGLVENLGGPNETGIGFAIGLERLLISLENQGVLEKETPTVDYYLVWTNEETRKVQFGLAQKLRVEGYRVELGFEAKKMKKQLAVANRKQAKWALILGEDELLKGNIQVKNLETGEQTFEKIGEWL